MQEITPPAKIDNSSVKLSADANWLVCEKICIPGSASLQLELPTSATSRPGKHGTFCTLPPLAAARLAADDAARANWSRAGSDLRLSVTSATLANYPIVDFYPLPQDNTVVGHPNIESRDAETKSLSHSD